MDMKFIHKDSGWPLWLCAAAITKTENGETKEVVSYVSKVCAGSKESALEGFIWQCKGLYPGYTIESTGVEPMTVDDAYAMIPEDAVWTGDKK